MLVIQPDGVPEKPGYIAMQTNKAKDYPVTEELVAKFWENVEKKGRKECWPWHGATQGRGYGYLYGPGRKKYHASHIAYFIRTGRHITVIARHKCDNPGCANPWHILDGDYTDNQRDKEKRGRQPRMFQPADFEKMYVDLRAGMSQKDVAKKHGISASYLCNLITQRRTPQDLRKLQKFTRKKLTDTMKAQMEMMRRSGHTYSQISAMTGVPYDTVSWWLRKQGVESPVRKLRPKK